MLLCLSGGSPLGYLEQKYLFNEKIFIPKVNKYFRSSLKHDHVQWQMMNDVIMFNLIKCETE